MILSCLFSLNNCLLVVPVLAVLQRDLDLRVTDPGRRGRSD